MRPRAIKSDPGLEKLMDHFKTYEKVGAVVGITAQAVSQWKRVPLDYVDNFCKKSRGQLSPKMLRPDFNWPG